MFIAGYFESAHILILVQSSVLKHHLIIDFFDITVIQTEEVSQQLRQELHLC